MDVEILPVKEWTSLILLKFQRESIQNGNLFVYSV